MDREPTLYSAGARILELISSNQEIAEQIYPQLLTLKEELSLFPVDDHISTNESKPISILDELDSDEKQEFVDQKSRLINSSAVEFLEKVQEEYQMNIQKMKQLSVTIANKCGIQINSQQFKTISGVYKWFDQYWEIIEPFTKTMLIVNCDFK